MSSDFDWFVLSIYGLLLSLTIQCFAKNSCGLLEWTLQVRSNAGLSFDERIEIAAKAFVLRVELILYCWIPNSSDCWVSISGLGCCFVPNPKTETAPWDPGILEPAFGLHNCVNSTCPYLFNISWNKVGMTFWYSELVDAYRFASCKAMFGADSRCTGLAYRPNMMRPRSKSWCSAKHCRLWSFIQWSKGKKKLRTVLGHHADSIMAWAATIQHAPRSTPYLTLFTFLQILSWTMRLVPGCCREGKVKANISSSATIKTEPKPTGHAPGAMRRIFAFSAFSFQLAASR